MVEKTQNQKKANKYFYAKGRRKNAVATIRLFEGEGESQINRSPLKEFYPLKRQLNEIEIPFIVTDTKGEFYFSAILKGGGKTGQLGALKLSIARALTKFNPDFKPILREKGLLTRDPRMVERKKAGLRKARKAPQFSKR